MEVVADLLRNTGPHKHDLGHTSGGFLAAQDTSLLFLPALVDVLALALDQAWQVCLLGHSIFPPVHEFALVSDLVCWVCLPDHFCSPLVYEIALVLDLACWVCLLGHFLSPLLDTLAWALGLACWFCPRDDLNFSPLVAFVAWVLSPEVLSIFLMYVDQTFLCCVFFLQGVDLTSLSPVFHPHGEDLTLVCLA